MWVCVDPETTQRLWRVELEPDVVLTRLELPHSQNVLHSIVKLQEAHEQGPRNARWARTWNGVRWIVNKDMLILEKFKICRRR